MLSHVIIGINNVEECIEFYDAVLKTLGHERRWRDENGAGYGKHDELGINTFWIGKPRDANPATVGNGSNVALLAPDRKSVDLFYQTALEYGGTDEGRPGIRAEAHDNFYAAYVRDPDGNKILAVCHQS